MLSQSFLCKHRNKKVTVTVEFPEQTDTKAEQEFIGGLKELYLRKLEIKSMQREKSALPYAQRNDMEGRGK